MTGKSISFETYKTYFIVLFQFSFSLLKHTVRPWDTAIIFQLFHYNIIIKYTLFNSDLTGDSHGKRAKAVRIPWWVVFRSLGRLGNHTWES